MMLVKLFLVMLDGISSNLLGLVCKFIDLVRDLVHGIVNFRLVLHEDWLDQAVVDDFRAIPGHGEEAPHQEQTLGQPVEGEPGEKKVREEFTHGEKCEDNPVGEPTSVIFLPCCF